MVMLSKDASRESRQKRDSFNQQIGPDGKVDILKKLILTMWKEVQALSGPQILKSGGSIDFYEEVRRFEIDLICRILEQTKGNQTEAAKLLGLGVTTLNNKIHRYNITRNASADNDGLFSADGTES